MEEEGTAGRSPLGMWVRDVGGEERTGQSREGGEKVAGNPGLKCHVAASEAIGSHGGL